MIQLLLSFIFSEITLIMVILFFETPVTLMKFFNVFMKSFPRMVLLLLMSIFFLMFMPRVYNTMVIQKFDECLFESTLKGAFLFLAIMMDRLEHNVGELNVRRKELTMACKRVKQLEAERKQGNDAESDRNSLTKALQDENRLLKNQLGLLRGRLNDQEFEFQAKEKETATLCKRIKQQESELTSKETTTLCKKIKLLESEIETKAKGATKLETRVKRLEAEIETKARQTATFRQRIEQLELERERENAIFVARLKLLELEGATNAANVDSFADQNKQLEGSLVEFNRLLDGNETLKNQLRTLTWRLSHQCNNED